jgi:hypothetical protein
MNADRMILWQRVKGHIGHLIQSRAAAVDREAN